VDLTHWGALGFGAVIGWYLYFINRYRKGDVQIGDLTTVIAAIGSGAVLKLFGGSAADGGTSLFGAYGIGIAIGFFGYFVSLMLLVWQSGDFTADWFLDGRRPNPPTGWGYGPDTQQPIRTMAAEAAPTGAGAGSTQNFYIGAPPAPGAASSAGDAKVEWPFAAGQQAAE
jgi:hypothetical protein